MRGSGTGPLCTPPTLLNRDWETKGPFGAMRPLNLKQQGEIVGKSFPLATPALVQLNVTYATMTASSSTIICHFKARAGERSFSKKLNVSLCRVQMALVNWWLVLANSSIRSWFKAGSTRVKVAISCWFEVCRICAATAWSTSFVQKWSSCGPWHG